ncbi:MAG: cation-translocating P-type ATPase [Bacteroides sp.]|nr:cation-translocating P-type ATPase [Bacillota bacterium]MCM1394258.1 cation-translocating P-type ATPase [[Eubacterium] siraeum]MCM1455757.1 cation-translocating P-type ATPase [Bacteroides sp.]
MESTNEELNISVPEAEFRTDAQRGLSSAEVDERKLAGKVNGNQNVKTKSVWQILRGNVVTFFNLVFVIFGIIMCFCVDWSNIVEAIGNFSFLILIVFNALIGIIQELRAKRTIDKLSLISAPKATVIRDGEEKEIAIADIVLDDITVLSAGSQICADAVVADGSIEVNESLITGEPDAILKQKGDRIMSGSFVVSGKAKAQVEHVGADNFATKISEGAKYFKKPNSEIWRSLMLIVKVMAMVIMPIGIALFCVKYFLQDSGGTVKQVIISAITSVIGMIPSGLVALSSTVFCVSVIRLSKRNILAQDLYCVETLARVDVLCLDKTGTITEGTMEVNGIAPYDKQEDDVKQIIRNVTAALADDNATANALRNYVAKLDVTGEAEYAIPFSSARKWSGARIDGVSYVLGAPEFVFKTPDENIINTTAEMAQKGFRVMVLASSASEFGENSLPANLKLESFIYITDTIRKEAPDTLRFFKEQGVNVKIISGDNPETVRAVALRAGLEDCDNFIDMSTLSTDEEVREAALKYTIFGRVLPDQKLTLINALKSNGHTVAMTGDGVNDVLALKSADCSIAMASGSDAAKNVSSLVLLDSNFASMPKVVAEGRRSINNLERSAALYLMKTVYNTLLAILFMIVSHPLPFTPQHLTLMGGVTIGLPSLVLALEPNDSIVEGRFLPKVLHRALPGGLTVLLGAIAVIICNSYFLTDLADSQATTLFIIIITFVGFMLLFKVSLPFNVVHLITFLLMIALFVCSFTVPFPKDFILNMFNLDNNVTWEMGKTILVICSILVPIYVAMCFGMTFIRKKRGAVWERRFTALDARMRARFS